MTGFLKYCCGIACRFAVLVLALAVLALVMLFLSLPARSQPVCVSECGNPHHTHSPAPAHRHSKHSKAWIVPVFGLGFITGGGGTVWWIGRSKEPPTPPPKADPQERIITVTPQIEVTQ